MADGTVVNFPAPSLEIRTNAPHDSLMQALTDMLKAAEGGKITGIVAITFDAEGAQHVWAGKFSGFTAIGHLEACKSEMVSTLKEAMKDD